MLDLSRKYPKLSYLITGLLLVAQLLILLDRVLVKFFVLDSVLFVIKLISLDEVIFQGCEFIIVLTFLIICFLLSLIFVRTLLLKIIVLCLTSVNFIWYAYFCIRYFDLIFLWKLENITF